MKTYLLVTIFLLLISNAAQAITYKVAASDAPPYYTITDGKASGILVQVISNIMDLAKLDYHVIPYPTKRVYHNIISGESHLYLGPIKSDMKGFEDGTVHSAFSPIQIELNLYYRGINTVRNKRDFKNKIVALVRGYSYGGLAKYIKNPHNKVKYIEVKDFVEGVALVRSKRADLFLDYTESEELHFDFFKQTRVRSSLFKRVPLYVIVSKKAPRYKELLRKIDSAYRK